MRLSLRHDIKNLINHIDVLFNAPYTENAIERFWHISFKQNKKPVNIVIAARRVLTHNDDRIFVTVIKNSYYPVDFFDVIKQNDRYLFGMKTSQDEKYYSIGSLARFEIQPTLLDELVNEFSGLIFDD